MPAPDWNVACEGTAPEPVFASPLRIVWLLCGDQIEESGAWPSCVPSTRPHLRGQSGGSAALPSRGHHGASEGRLVEASLGRVIYEHPSDGTKGVLFCKCQQ